METGLNLRIDGFDTFNAAINELTKIARVLDERLTRVAASFTAIDRTVVRIAPNVVRASQSFDTVSESMREFATRSRYARDWMEKVAESSDAFESAARRVGRGGNLFSNALSGFRLPGRVTKDFENEGKRAGNSLLSGFASILGIRSPSTEFQRLGREVVRGFEQSAGDAPFQESGNSAGRSFATAFGTSAAAYIGNVANTVLNSVRNLGGQIRNEMQNIGRSLQQQGRQLIDDGLRTVTAGGLAALLTAGPVAGFTNQAIGFEESLINSQAVLGATSEEMAVLRDQIIDLGATARSGPMGVADAFYDIVGGVTDASQRMDILQASIATAEAGNADLKATTTGLISVMNAYGKEVAGAGRVSDTFTQIVGAGVGTMDQFVSAIGPIAGIARQAGVSFEELGAAEAYLTTQGFSASESATRLQSLMAAFLKPSTEMQKALEAAGYASGQAAIEQLGLVGATQLLSDELGNSPDAIAQAVGSVEALGAALALTGEGSQEFIDDFIGGIDGATAAARAIQLTSVAAQLDILKASFQTLAITIGDLFLPMVAQAIRVATPLVNGLREWITTNPELAGTIARVAAVVAVLGGGLVTLSGIASILAGAVLLPLGAAFSFVGTVLLSPVGIVVGVTALAGVLLSTTEIGQRFIGWIKDFIGSFVDVDEVLTSVTAAIPQLQQGFSLLFSGQWAAGATQIGQTLRGIFGAESVRALPQRLAQGIRQLSFANVQRAIATRFGEIRQQITESLRNLVSGNFGTEINLQSVTDGILEKFRALDFSQAQTIFETHFRRVVGFIKNAATNIFGASGTFNTLTTEVNEGVSTALSSIDTGQIENAASQFGGTILGIVGAALSVVFGPVAGIGVGLVRLLLTAIENDFLGIRTRLEEVGFFDSVNRAFETVRALIGGVIADVFGGEAPVGTLLSGLGDAFNAAAAALGPALQELGQGFGAFLGNLGSINLNTIQSIATGIGSLISGVVTGIGIAGVSIIRGLAAALPKFGIALASVVRAVGSLLQGDFDGFLLNMGDAFKAWGGAVATFGITAFDNFIHTLEALTGLDLPDSGDIQAFLEPFASTFEILARVIDASLIQTLEKLFGGVIGFVQEVTKGDFTFVVPILGAVVALLGGLGDALGFVGAGISAFTRALSALAQGDTTRFLQELGVSFNSIVNAISSIGTGALDIVIDTLEALGVALPDGQGVKDSLQPIMDIGQDLLDNAIGPAFQALSDGVKGLLDNLGSGDFSFVESTLTAVAAGLGAVIGAIGILGIGVLNGIGAALPSLGAAIADFGTAISNLVMGDPAGFLTSLGDGINHLGDAVGAFAVDTFNSIITSLETLTGADLPNFQEVVDSLQPFIDQIKAFADANLAPVLKDIGDNIGSFVSNLTSGDYSGLLKAGGALLVAGGAIAASVAAILGALGAAGIFILQAFSQMLPGLGSAIASFGDSVTKLTSGDVGGALTDFAQGLKDLFIEGIKFPVNFLGNAVEGIENLTGLDLSTVKQPIEDILEALQGLQDFDIAGGLAAWPGIIENAQVLLQGAADGLASIFEGLATRIRSAFEGIARQIELELNRLLLGIETTLSDLQNTASSVGVNLGITADPTARAGRIETIEAASALESQFSSFAQGMAVNIDLSAVDFNLTNFEAIGATLTAEGKDNLKQSIERALALGDQESLEVLVPIAAGAGIDVSALEGAAQQVNAAVSEEVANQEPVPVDVPVQPQANVIDIGDSEQFKADAASLISDWLSSGFSVEDTATTISVSSGLSQSISEQLVTAFQEGGAQAVQQIDLAALIQLDNEALLASGQTPATYFIDGLVLGLSDPEGLLTTAAAATAQAVADEVVNVWAVKSPSAVAQSFGQMFVEGLVLGLSDPEGLLLAAVQAVLEPITTELDSRFSLSAATLYGFGFASGFALGLNTGLALVILELSLLIAEAQRMETEVTKSFTTASVSATSNANQTNAAVNSIVTSFNTLINTAKKAIQVLNDLKNAALEAEGAAKQANKTFNVTSSAQVLGRAVGGLAKGWTMVGERGRELVYFGSEATVLNNRTTEAFMSGLRVGFGQLTASPYYGGAMALGGNIQASNIYQIMDTDDPEIFRQSDGRTFLLPAASGQILNARPVSGGSDSMSFNPTYQVSIDARGSNLSETDVENWEERITTTLEEIERSNPITRRVNMTGAL